MASEGSLLPSSISWLPGALKTGTPAVFAMSRNSLYSSWILESVGSLPLMVSPVQRTKAAAGLKPLTAPNIFPGVGGCGEVLCAGRLSPAMTKVNFVGSDGDDKVPVLGRGEREGIWQNAAAPQNWMLKVNNRADRRNLARSTKFLSFVSRSWRKA